MTPKPITVQEEATLETAAQLMLSNKISGLPVMDGEKVVGILTESDLFRVLCGMLGIGEKGARVQMTVRDDADLLQNIRGRLKGLAVRSLVTVHDPNRNAWDVVMRVRGRAAKVS
jgi:acetoin utilization protein AcuB